MDGIADKDPVEERVVVEFLQQYLEDGRDGAVSSIEVYLDRFPGHETRLRAEYAALAGESDRAREAPAGRSGGPPDDPADEAHRFGPYRLLRILGQGGQGVVYLAEDDRHRRTVALKILPGLGGGVPGRVQREVESLSRLDHPGICIVHAAGAWQGQAYVAMRYVPGETLEQFLARRAPMPTGSTSRAELLRRVALIEAVARALHAAHEAGVVHRDIKPANIMIHAETGAPVVLDFGLARVDDSSVPTLTRTGELVGTTQYMAPERLLGESSPDPRSDVWSLGVTLYEVLTGSRPFDAPSVEGVARRVETEEPTDPRRLQRAIPRDLAVVVACALEKSLERRYQSALALADDLARVQRAEPIAARPVSAVGRLGRWAHRNPAPAALIVVLVAGLLGAIAVAGQLLDRAEQDRRTANQLAELARREADARSQSQVHLAASQAQQARMLALAAEPGRRWEILQLVEGAAAALAASRQSIDGVPDGPGGTADTGPGLAELRGQAWSALCLDDVRPVRVVQSSSFGNGGFDHAAERLALAWVAPDFARFGVRVVAIADGRELARLDHGDLLSVAFEPALSADGTRLVTPRRDLSTLDLWDTTTGERVAALTVPPSLRPSAKEHDWALAFGPDGSWVAGVVGGSLGAPPCAGYLLWELGSDEPQLAEATVPLGPPWLSVCTDGSTLLVPSTPRGVGIVDTRSLTQKTLVFDDPVVTASWLERGGLRRVVALTLPAGASAAGHRLEVRALDGRLGNSYALGLEVQGHAGLAVHPDGDLVAFADVDHGLHVFDLARGTTRLRIDKAHTGVIEDIAFRAGTRELLSHSGADATRVWELSVDASGVDEPRRPAASGWASVGRVVAVSPGGDWLAWLASEDELVVRAAVGWQDEQRLVVDPPASGPFRLLFADDGQSVALVSDPIAHLWDLASGSVRRVPAAAGTTFRDATFAPDGELTLVQAGRDVVPSVRSIDRDHTRVLPDVPSDAWLHLDGTGQRLSVVPSTGSRGGLRLSRGEPSWVDVASGEIHTLPGVDGSVFRKLTSMTFSADGRWLAAHHFVPDTEAGSETQGSLGDNERILVWRLPEGRLVHSLPATRAHGRVKLAFVSDAGLLAYSRGGSVVLVDLSSEAEVLRWTAAASSLGRLEHLPTGELRTWVVGGAPRRWNLPRLRQQLDRMGLGW